MFKWNIQAKSESMQDVLKNIMRERNWKKDEMLNFINNNQEIHSPFLFKNMKAVKDKINLAIKKGERICIIGDYDCDGVTATYVGYRGLKNMGADVIWIVPARTDGYGLKENLIDRALALGAKLIITVDNGIAACKEVEYAKSLGLDVVITDHHEPGETVPDCLIINPKYDTNYPFNGLCGCSVIYKVIQAITSEEKYDKELFEELEDMVTIATIADVMDLIDENRIIVTNGLTRLNKTANIGLKMLLNFLKLSNKSKLSSTDIGFKVGPCINAAGRLKTADIAVELLLCDDEATAIDKATELIKLNNERKKIQRNILDEITVEDSNNVIIVTSEKFKHGIVGIIAGDLANMYKKPCFVFGGPNEEGIVKGSARSISDFNIFNCIQKAASLGVNGGGHQSAAGASIRYDNIDKFQELCNDLFQQWLDERGDTDLTPTLNIISEIEFDILTERLANNIIKLGPFGAANPNPIFITKNVNIARDRVVGDNKDTVQFDFVKNGYVVKGIAFNNTFKIYENLHGHTNVNIAYNIELNEWPTGVFNVQLIIVDMERA